MHEQTLVHTIPPLYDANARVLLLGSFPSPKSRENGFFYGHPRNRFWQVLTALYHVPVPQTIEQKKTLCLSHGIALWDVVAQCTITGASDASIRNAVPNDLRPLLAQTQITRLFATGATAASLYRRLIQPTLGLAITQLPSTSPANAAWSLERLIKAYEYIL